MRHIAVRVEDDLYYSAKKYVLEQETSLQDYVVDVIKRDLEAHNAYTGFPRDMEKIVDGMSVNDLAHLSSEIEKLIDAKSK